jgi:cytochrome c-type biogenesis protein CcsB
MCYLLAFLCYSGYLIARSGRARARVQMGAGAAVRVRAGALALAGAGDGTPVATVTSRADEAGEAGPVARASRADLLGNAGFGLVALAWVSLTTALVLRWIQAGHPPYVTLYEITTMLVWGTTLVYLVLFEGVLKTRAAGAFVTLLIFCLQSYALWFIPADLKDPIPLVPALRSYWLMIHVSFAILAYSSFATAAGAGLAFLAKHYLKNTVASSLPSEAAIEEFMFRAVAVGFPLQTMLLITGAIWAQEAWTKPWSWDPKETWALVTWLTYAAYLHVRVQRGVRGVTMAWLSLIGFGVVLFTFMGVNYLVSWFGLQSMHTYNLGNASQPPSLGVGGVLVVATFVVLLAVALFSWLRIRFPMRARTRASVSAPAPALPTSTNGSASTPTSARTARAARATRSTQATSTQVRERALGDKQLTR